MRRLSSQLLVFTLLCCGFLVNGQSTLSPYVPKIIPPSPTAAALGKYGEVPVSYATGIPQIQIPIYTIKGQNLELPIALSYHAGGIKVGEKPGWLGMSWSLTGGNGVITRTIRSLPDNHGSNGYLANFALVNDAVITAEKQQQILDGQLDGEPDDYSYNFGTRSGKLFFQQEGLISKAYTIPYENLLFSVSESEVGVVDENGTVYSFGTTEKLESDPQNLLTQTWHLTGISDVNGTENISFQYTAPFAVTDPYQPEEMTRFYTSFGCDAKDPILVDKGQTRHEIRLQRITFEEIELQFKGLTRLDTVVVLESDTIVKEFVLEYSNNVLVGLSEYGIGENGVADSNVLRHVFSYYGEAPLTPSAKDHWGFKNGATKNLNLFPIAGKAGEVISNREPSGAPGVQAGGTLKSITYPTGGTTEFEFEANTYWSSAGFNQTSLGEKVQKLELLWIDGMGGAAMTETHTFSVLRDQQVRIDIKGIYNDGQGEGLMVDEGQLMSVKIYRTDTGMEVYSHAVPTGELSTIENPAPVTLPPNEYEFEITLLPPPQSTPLIQSMRFEAELIYNLYVENDSVVEATAGGIRISKITTHDGFGGSPDQIKSYLYTTVRTDRNGQSIVTSSGSLSVTQPVYTYSYEEWVTDPTATAGPIPGIKQCVQNAVTNGEEAVAGMGSPVYYSEVTELMGPNGEFGKSKYYFHGATTNGAGYPYIPPKMDYRGSLPVSVEHYKKTGSGFELVAKKETSYQFKDSLNAPHFRSIQGIKVILVRDAPGVVGQPDQFITEAYPYRVASEWYFINRTKDVQYLNGGALEKQIDFFYANPAHIQLTKTEQLNSDGSKTIQEMKYPDDYTNSNTTVASMKNLHMASTVLRQSVKRTKNGTTNFVGATVNKYEKISVGSAPGGQGVLLKEVYALEAATPVPLASIPEDPDPFNVTSHFSKKITFNTFDTYGNALQYTPTDGAPVSYVWGCDGKRPVAKASNCASNAIGFTGFECEGNGNWAITGGTRSVDGISKSGKYGWLGGTLIKNVLPYGSYVVTLWAKGSGSIAVNGVAKNVSANWQLLEWMLTPTSDITLVNGNLITIDDVRFRPVGAQMTTYSYDVAGRLMSEEDTNNNFTFYEYDDFKRLKITRNHKGEIVSSYDYHYHQSN